MTLNFDNSYARLPAAFFTAQAPQTVTAPKLLTYNSALAVDLGLPAEAPADAADLFSGNALPTGAEPIAQVYAGHQFGGFSPRLGDGRAVLLGEVIDTHGQRRDLQLKGAGRTPYSRNGDGRAWLGPVLREYLVSEAMHALKIPTTRALAACATGENIQRETVLPGAVLTRVASSHIRVGTFQYFAAQRDTDALRALYEYSVQRHYPTASTPLDFLNGVIARQAMLVAQWMSVGFIHGVMNTDNSSISGETIDYGPCAFIDTYHPATVYSAIDQQGRYAYQNQPNIITWNMAQLATSLLPLESDQEATVEAFTQAVHAMPALIQAHWLTLFRTKLGLAEAGSDDEALITDLLTLMAEQSADFTNMFRALSGETARDQFADPSAFDAWETRWKTRRAQETAPPVMDKVNPAFIPRNHRVEQMIEAAVAGDMAPFVRMQATLAQPFTDQPEAADLARPPAPDEVIQNTFCGT